MSVIDPSKFRNLLTCWLPLALYCVAIYIQSGKPSSEHIPDVRYLDKLLHFGAYGLLGILFYRAFETLLMEKNKNLLILISIGSAALFGISDEIHQYFVPFRHADMMDAVANTIGSILGVSLFYRWKTRKNRAGVRKQQRR